MTLVRLIREYVVDADTARAAGIGGALSRVVNNQAYLMDLGSPTVHKVRVFPAAELRVRDVFGCARCGNDHDAVKFAPLLRPIRDPDVGEFAWWAPCPVNGEPILLATVAKP